MGSIARPFKWDTSTNPDSLKEMSDNELEYLSYYFRLYYASQLNTGHNGSIVYDSVGTHSGSNYPRVGSIFRTIDSTWNPNADNWHYPSGGVDPLDQRKNMVRNTNPDDYGGSPDDDNATDPGETAFDNSNATRNTYRIIMTKKHANSTLDDLPSNSTYNSDGYLVWNGAGKYLQIDNTVADIAHTVLKHSNQQMISGDELGTYRVQTSTPGSDWTVLNGSGNNEFIFTDSIMTYNSGATPGTESNEARAEWNLYLKTSHTFGGTTTALVTEPFGWDSNTYKQKPITNTGNLIQNILYPIYIQEDFADLTGHGYPEYRWKTSSSVSAWEGYRGTIADASYENSTARTSYLNPGDSTYYYDRYGAGAYTTNAIYYFIMNIGTSSNFIR